MAATSKLRCALYTRKSSEEGLDQAFNSLHAQREACEAYVKSQAGEGWTALAKPYDDGGISGGTMERPALKQLLADIERGQIDVVVVYKVDRLTRSLADFAKIIEIFDRRGVSFVSVTQAFNTTSSMGRLTLNVLLSFAQFEREVTGERIRDKIAASKAKGMWMGGCPPLGYDIPVDRTSRALAVNPAEAEGVRDIFDRYLRLKSVNALREDLKASGVRSKAWVTRKGRTMGGYELNSGALFHLLQSRLYLGEIAHKGQIYPGAHEAFIASETFAAVQAQMAANAAVRRHRPGASLPLKGLIFDAEGRRMGPSFGYGRWGGRHAYYVSVPVQRGHPSQAETIARVSADPLNALVLDRVGLLVGRVIDWTWLTPLIRRVELRADGIQITLTRRIIDEAGRHALDRVRGRLGEGDQLTEELETLVLWIAVRPVFRGGRTWLVKPHGSQAAAVTAPDQPLLKALAQSHAGLAAHSAAPTNKADDWRSARAIADSYLRRLAGLAFLAPDIQHAILEGRQPAGMSAQQIVAQGAPLAWADQRSIFGFQT